MDFYTYLTEELHLDFELLYTSIIETVQMTFFSVFFTVLVGLPLGILLYLMAPNRLLAMPKTYAVVSLIVNILRSIPFVILLVCILPLTKILTGTIIGVRGVVPPLVFSSIPFFARLVEGVLNDLNEGIIEASKSMGATTLQTIRLVIIPETLPSLVGAITVTTISIIGYTAMAGVVGGGGLGDVAITYGYNLFEYPMLWAAVFFIVIFVQLIQTLGNYLQRKLSH